MTVDLGHDEFGFRGRRWVREKGIRRTSSTSCWHGIGSKLLRLLTGQSDHGRDTAEVCGAHAYVGVRDDAALNYAICQALSWMPKLPCALISRPFISHR